TLRDFGGDTEVKRQQRTSHHRDSVPGEVVCRQIDTIDHRVETALLASIAEHVGEIRLGVRTSFERQGSWRYLARSLPELVLVIHSISVMNGDCAGLVRWEGHSDSERAVSAITVLIELRNI